jgi:dTDP-4-dehydrorhamnose reductase
MSERLLVTGAAGLLGQAVLREARARGFQVIGSCSRTNCFIDGEPLFAADLNRQGCGSELIAAHRPASVIHCAAATDVDWCEENPGSATRINVEASGELAEAAANIGAFFLYVSTDAVYEGDHGNYSETDPVGPVNVYARTKLLGEDRVRQSGGDVAIVRTTVYGWRGREKRTLSEWILDRLESGGSVPGFSDVVFTPMLSADLSEVLLTTAERRLCGLWNVAGSEACSKFEFARRLAEKAGYSPDRVEPVRLDEGSLKARRPRNTSLRSERITAALGRSMPGVDSGLTRFLQVRTLKQALPEAIAL